MGTYLSPETCEEKSFFEDKDRDGYGRKEVQLWVCQKPEGYSEFFTDCDDGNPLINPEAVESCDESDNNCNNLIDENLVQTCYTICEEGLETCIEGTWKNCTASLPELEICDYVDNDCNGLIDEKIGGKALELLDIDKKGLARNIGRGEEDKGQYDEQKTVPLATFACILIKKEI